MIDKNIKILIFEACLIVSLSLLLILPNKKSGVSKVCFQNNCFDVEVVNTPKEMERGLMFRDHLDKDKGMLFVFEKEGDYPFWTKNTLIPLDMIWINQNQEVVFIKENAQPCQRVECPTINPTADARYVLEVNGGVSKVINLKLRDRTQLNY